MIIQFYEKPGCQNNGKQKKLLQAHGVTLEARNLLTEDWTVDRLRPFFANKPVQMWFNPAATQIKDGSINPTAYDEQSALLLMIANPILIRRPLIQYQQFFSSGFDWELLIDVLQIEEAEDLQEDIVSCKHGTHAHHHAHDAPHVCHCQSPQQDAD